MRFPNRFGIDDMILTLVITSVYKRASFFLPQTRPSSGGETALSRFFRLVSPHKALAAVILVLASMQIIAAPNTLASSSPSEQPKTLTLSGLDGKTLAFSQLQGKIVYIKFWASWCPLCLAGLEDFSRLAKQYQGSDKIAVISIVAPGLRGEVDKADFIEWAKAQQIDFPVLFDESGAANEKFGVIGYPTSVYLNPKGLLAEKVAGDESNEQIVSKLSSLAAD